MEGDEDEVNGKKDTREEKHKRTCVTKTGRRTGWDGKTSFWVKS